MRKVVQVDGVQVIMTIFTNVVSAQIPLAQQFKVPLLSRSKHRGLLPAAITGPSRFCAPVAYAAADRGPLEKHGRETDLSFHPNTPIAGYGSGLVKAAADRLGAAHEQHCSNLARPITAACHRAPRRLTRTLF